MTRGRVNFDQGKQQWIWGTWCCAPMVLAHGIACNGAYKRMGILHCKVGLEVSGEGSLGQIGQGFLANG